MAKQSIILLIIPIVGLVGTTISLVAWHRFSARVQVIGKVTAEERRWLFTQSIVSSIFYGVACGLFWLLVEMTSPIPVPLWRHILSSLPCFGIGVAGGLLMTGDHEFQTMVAT